MTVSSISRHRYLVVDDEEFIRALVARILETSGATDVRKASGGAEALGSIDAEGAPDIILCDLNMPGMDGIEFLRHLVERNYGGGIALISGEDKRILETAQQLGRAQNLNILGFLSKPVDAAQLAELIGRSEVGPESRRSRPGVSVKASELRAALAEDRIAVHFQPKVAVATRELVGVETLARWHDPERGFIPPDVFVAVAEANGLIDALTERVFSLAMRQGAAWRAAGLDLKVAVNVSMDNLNRLEFVDFAVGTIREAGMDPHQVVLEVTETRLIANVVVPLEILTRLRLKGIALSIDDFGTGHSSLEQLKRIPFTELKIDRAFVNGAQHNETARSILESSVVLAQRLGMTVVAEGVETEEDWDLVASLGVDLVQGYFVSRPLPPDDLPAWLAGWTQA